LAYLLGLGKISKASMYMQAHVCSLLVSVYHLSYLSTFLLIIVRHSWCCYCRWSYYSNSSFFVNRPALFCRRTKYW